MPLPPALLQKLAKRGLVQKGKNSSKQTTNVSHQSEEIIAEDYDEEPYPYDYEPVKKPMESYWGERLKRRIVDGSTTGYKNCPNKYNIFHKCTLYCVSTYGDGILEPDREYLRRKRKLLQKYPLPKDWKEVFDSGCGVHYYWHTKTETVSWLPPNHPKAMPSKSAAYLRKELEASLIPESEEPEDIDAIISGEKDIGLTSPSVEVKIIEPPPIKPPPIKKPKTRDLDKAIRSRSERRRRTEASESGILDPMDPAAYSDIPRGNWSAGLQQENKKTGADTTASGALFQMRPYPSPSAVLLANKSNKKENNESDSEEDED